MKRILLVLLCLTMLLTFASCNNSKNSDGNNESNPKMIFESAELMKEAIDGVWMNCSTGDYFLIKEGQLSKFDETTKSEILNRLVGIANEFDTFEAFYNRYLKECGEEIEYDPNSGSIILKSTNEVFFEMDSNDLAFNTDIIMFEKCTDINSENDIREDIIKEYINLKYPNAPTNKDVQFDKYGNIGKSFMISGTAELDDYYNWGYRDFEAAYFCIQITPTDGSYSDRWYIYASRNEFSELFDKLKNGSKKVNLVARLTYPDTGINNMATLVEYF